MFPPQPSRTVAAPRAVGRVGARADRLAALKQAIDQALGPDPEMADRRISPARHAGALERSARPRAGAVSRRHAGLASPPFAVRDFHLYESRTLPEGAVYTRLHSFNLARAGAAAEGRIEWWGRWPLPRTTPGPTPDDDDRDDDDDSGGWPKGLVAVGGRLDADTLTRAYRAGIFPWSSDPEITWWSPDPRAIFDLDEFRAVAQPAQEHQARGLDVRRRSGLRGGDARLRRAHRRSPQHLDQRRLRRAPTPSCTAAATPTAWRSTRASTWWVVCTA